jgi:hypothetical protein
MVVFDPMFRPWPHIYQDKNRSKKLYLHLEKHRERDINKLRAFKGADGRTKRNTPAWSSACWHFLGKELLGINSYQSGI